MVCRRYTKPRYLFNDVGIVGRASHALDLISKERVAVPSANVALFGWVCSDRSTLNPNRQAFAQSYTARVGKSATTFDSCCEYLSRHRPRLAIGENVTTLDDGETPGTVGHVQSMYVRVFVCMCVGACFHALVCTVLRTCARDPHVPSVCCTWACTRVPLGMSIALALFSQATM